MARLLTQFTIVTALLGTLLSQADAKLISAGNTNASDAVGGPGGFQGTINTAVYDLTGGTPGDSYGTGYTGMDSVIGGADQDYLFLYSVLNVGSSPREVFRATVDVSSGSVTMSDTFVTSLHFVDGQGPVTAAADNDLGNDARAFTLNAPFDAMAAGDLSSVGLADATGLKTPWLTLTANTFGMYFYPVLEPGESGVIVGFKASGVGLRSAGLIDGSVARGMVPSTVPEPSTTLAMLSLVPALLWYRRRRK